MKGDYTHTIVHRNWSGENFWKILKEGESWKWREHCDKNMLNSIQQTDTEQLNKFSLHKSLSCFRFFSFSLKIFTQKEGEK